MKNVLLYNYNLELDKVETIDDYSYSFYIDYEKFYFKAVDRPESDISEIFSILTANRNNFHKIIPNRFSQLLTPYKGKNFVLLKINGPENNEIDILDLLGDKILYDKEKSDLIRTDWNTLWSSKVDYLEYQLSELGTTHKVARHSFSYYVGLAENAIEYFNLLKPESIDLVVAHRRIKSPFMSKDFCDPLDIVIDYKVRDFASYFKMKFFEKEDVLKEVKLLVDRNILTPLEYNLLFARLLYPSYYFDGLKKVLENGEDDDILLKYIERVDDYEIFLKDVHEMFKKKSSMIKIDWLIKTS